MMQQTLAHVAITILFLFIFSSIAVYVSTEDTVNDVDVVVLSDSNFQSFIDADIALVEFYAPWCGHCKALAPEYAAAATELKKEGILLGKVDATVESALASKFGVSAYPTLKVFRNGKDSEYKATGPNARKTPGIISYMKKQKRPAIAQIASSTQLDDFIASGDSTLHYVIVGFFSSQKSSQLRSAFSLISAKIRDEFVFGAYEGDNFADLLKAKAPEANAEEGIVAFRYGEPIVFSYSGAPKQAALEEFIRGNALPQVGEITDDNSEFYNSRGLPIAKFVMKVDKNFQSKNQKYFNNRFKKIADSFSSEIMVAVADREGQKSLVDLFNLQNEEISLVIQDRERKWKYEPEDESKVGKIDVEGWTAWVRTVLDGDVGQYVRSERPPKKNDGPVKVVTGQTFGEIVNDPSKDVFIEFYAPWCGHCKALEPKWKELGEKVRSHEDVVIAKMDATANDYDREKWKVSGYPTVYFRPAAKSSGGKLPSAELYEGPREVDDLYKFLKSNAKSMKKKKNKE